MGLAGVLDREVEPVAAVATVTSVASKRFAYVPALVA